MRPHPIRIALAGAAVAAATLVATVGFASAQAGQTGSLVSGCDNPVLNKDLAGWGPISGAAPFRYPLADHASATAAYVQANNPGADPRVWMPQQPVKAGQQWVFAVDARTDVPGQGRMLVDWYSSANAYLGQSSGAAVTLPAAAPTTWYRIAGEFTAPAGAARANVLADADLPAGADFSLTGCDYRPGEAGPVDPPETTTPPPPTETSTPVPTTTVPPPTSTEPPQPGDQTEAAVKYGWGTPIAAASDEFNYVGAPNAAKWGLYDGAGHAGNGRRVAARNNVDGNKLIQTGLSNGDSAGMASSFNQQYGRWEARVRSFNTGTSGNQYHPLLIIWPQSNRWPDHGEYDFLENGAPGMQCAEAFLHLPGHTPYTQEYAKETNCGAPLSEWHNVALDWTPQALVGYIDGREWFRFGAHDLTAMPSGHLTLQLDNFYGSGMRAASYEADWVRVYAP